MTEACDKPCRQSEHSGADAGKPAPALPKSEHSGDAQKPPRLQGGNQPFPGTRMLFALQSMAKRMSPVLSSYVTHQQHEPATQQSPSDGAVTQGGQRGQAQLVHSQGSEWIGQQLQKAYKGLTSSLTAGTASAGQQHTTDVSNADKKSATEGVDQAHLHDAAQTQQASSTHIQQPSLTQAQRYSAQTQQSSSPQQSSPASTQHSWSQTSAHNAAQQSQSARGPEQSDVPQASPSADGQPASLNMHGQQHAGAGADHQQAAQHGKIEPSSPDQQEGLDSSAAATDQHQQGGQDAGQISLQQPLVAGNEGCHSAVKPHRPHGIPDRVPAAIALEASEEPAAVYSSQTKQPATEGDTAGEEELQELKQPRVVEGKQQQQKKASPTPVFVPIVVAMEAQDHKVMVEEWYSRQMAVSGLLSNNDVSDKDMTDSANATYARIRLLQDHLCMYDERNVPVVSVNFANFSDTLDQLHDYLLQCIESAMQQ